MEILPDLSGQTMEAAAMEGLRQQAITMNSAVGNAEDAVACDQSLRILSRRWAELDQAYDSYKLAFHRYRRVADKDSCATAREARRLILGFWDKAMDELEAHMEVKEMENVGAEQEEEEFSAEEDKEVEEPRVDKQGGGALEPGEGDQSDAKDELVCRAAKDDVLQGGGAIDPGEGDQSDAKDELECGAAKDDFCQGGGAREPGEGDREISIKVVREVCVKKVELGFAAKDVLKEFCIPKSNYEVEFASRSKVFSSGGLDPGEDAAKSVEEKQVDVEDVLGFCAAEDDSEFGAIKDEIEYCAAKDAEFELLRFVTTGCRAQDINSEYG